MTTKQHTPLPWKAEKARTLIHISGSTFPICEISVSPPKVPEADIRSAVIAENEANAAFIVRACNSHSSAVDKLYAVYVTETERLASGRSNYAPSFLKELEELLCIMDAELMRSNHGKTIAKAEGGAA